MQSEGAILSGMDEGREACAANCSGNLGRSQALSVGEHQAVPGAAFDHRGCHCFRGADHATN
jgi:hypothetical protein